MGYTTLLIDLDHTLLDSEASERLAFRRAMEIAGVTDPDRYFMTYTEINGDLWAAVERHELAPDDVKVLRFERLVDVAGLEADVSVLAEAYVAGLGALGDLYPGTRDALALLSERATLGLVTNGIGQVQRSRIDRLGLERYFDAISISGELGFAKPGVEIFAATFRQLGGPSRDSALMVGDSLSSDIQGGLNYGIATCWFNPAGAPLPDGIVVDHQVAALHETLPFIDGSAALS